MTGGVVALLLVVAALVGYSVYAQWTKQPNETAIPTRVWVAITGAFTALGALVTQFVNQ